MSARNARPWGAWGLRVLCSALLLVSGVLLVSTSTFTQRMRNDVPSFVPGLDGPQGMALLLTLPLALLPLLAGRGYLRPFLLSAFLMTFIGAYWWTTIPWDELLTESDFPAQKPPGMLDYALVASPALIAAFYAAMNAASTLRADFLRRGADPDEARRASAASFLAGAGALAATVVLALGLWLLLATGALAGVAALKGVPALALAALLGLAAFALGARRLKWQPPRAPIAPAESAPEDEARTGRWRALLARRKPAAP